MTFQQTRNQNTADVDLPALQEELSRLRAALARQRDSSEPQHDIAIRKVAAAETAAQRGDGPSALDHLKKAGPWVWDVANQIGVNVVTASVKAALGL